MLQLHLSDQQFNCLLRCVTYTRDLTVYQNAYSWVKSLNYAMMGSLISPCATYMHQWIGLALVQIMVVAYSAPSHHLNQCWVIVNWTLRNKLQWNFNQNIKLSIHENASEYIICEKAAILSRGRWVNEANDLSTHSTETVAWIQWNVMNYLCHFIHYLQRACMQNWSWNVSVWIYMYISLNFSICLISTLAEAPIKYQSNIITCITNLPALRHHVVLYSVVPL